MALSQTSKEVVFLRKLLEEMGFSNLLHGATQIFCDNQSAIQLCKNHTQHGRSKHVDIRYHYCRKVQEEGAIKVLYLLSN